jgi:hypothetical protein
MEDDCQYCLKNRKRCGKKMSKSEYLNKNGPPNPEIHSTQASVFIEFWIKSTKLQYPAASEEELLNVFKKSIEQKEEGLKLKRGKATVDEEDSSSSSSSTAGEPMRDGSIDTTPADTPPLSKKRLSSPSHTQPELLTINTSTLRSSSQDCVVDAPAESILMPQASSGTSTINACPIQEHTGLFFKFEDATTDFEPFPSLGLEADHSLDHEENYCLEHKESPLDHEESHSLDLEESHSLDFEQFSFFHSLDHEENGSLEQGMEEVKDYRWDRYMMLDGE